MGSFPKPNVGRSSIRGYLVFEDGHCEPISDCSALLRRGEAGLRFLWLDFKGCPNGEDEVRLKAAFAWHPTVMQRFRARSSRPRIDDYEGYTHVTLHALRSGFAPADRHLTLELDAVLGPDYLITVHESSTPPDLDEVYQTLPEKSQTLRSPDMVLHRLVYTMVDRYIPVVDAIDGRLSELEQEALYRPRPALLEKIVLARDDVLRFKHVLIPQVQILNEFAETELAGVRPDNRAYFRNSEQRMRHLLDDLAIYQEVARNALDLYQSAVQYRTNEIIRALTVVSIPLMVISLVTGLYGMNVPIPFANFPHSFGIISVLSAAMFLGMMIYFKKRDWF